LVFANAASAAGDKQFQPAENVLTDVEDTVEETTEAADDAADTAGEAVEAVQEVVEDEEELVEEAIDAVTVDPEPFVAPTSIAAPAAGLVPDAIRYRFMSREEFFRFEDATGLNATEFLSCIDGEDAGRRERLVTNRIPLEITVAADGGLTIMHTEEDEDGSIQECVDDELDGMELEETPAEFAGSRFRYIYYEDNYYSRRRTRHSEIIALYTLTGISAAVGVGSFIAARQDDAEREELLSFSVEGTPEYDNLAQRATRFRRAGWSMVGVSVVSFVTGTLLYTRNREIENSENPVLVFSPGSPTGDLGFTLSSQF
jgi:hypothetical protein